MGLQSDCGSSATRIDDSGCSALSIETKYGEMRCHFLRLDDAEGLQGVSRANNFVALSVNNFFKDEVIISAVWKIQDSVKGVLMCVCSLSCY